MLGTCTASILRPAIPGSPAAAGSARGRLLAAPPSTAARLAGAGRADEPGGRGGVFARLDGVIEAPGPEGSSVLRGVAVSAVAQGVQTCTERLEGQPGTQPPPLSARWASLRLGDGAGPGAAPELRLPRPREPPCVQSPAHGSLRESERKLSDAPVSRRRAGRGREVGRGGGEGVCREDAPAAR